MIRTAVAVLATAGALMAAAPTEIAAQAPGDSPGIPRKFTNWWVPGAVGGASLGGALGYGGTAIAVWTHYIQHPEGHYPRRRFQQATWTVAIAGAFAGGIIGMMVDDKVLHGRPVSVFQNKAVRFATVLAGAGIGAAVSYRVLTDYHEQFYWNAPRVVAVVGIGPSLGAIGGYLAQHWSPYPKTR